MKQSGQSSREELPSMIQQVLSIFQELNSVQSASKAQVFDLVKLFRQHPIHFQEAWELAYLKIFKIFHERANRKMPTKYEQLATTFFTQLLPPSNHIDVAASTFYDFFLQFLAEAVFSSLTGIRITGARMLFHLLKAHGKAGQKAQQKILKAVFYLVRLKVSTYKQIGIKLASIVLGWQGTLKEKLEDQIFKIMAVEDNEQIRKMAITNLWINKNNLDRVLVRLRDKWTDIRTIVLRKLVGEKLSLSQTTLSHRYKLLYDGYGNKESSVQQDTIKFFLRFFEQPEDIRRCFSNFVQMFAPHTLLAHPHLYTLFDLLIVDMVEEMPLNQIADFVRKFTNELRTIGKGGSFTGHLLDLIWLKNIGRSQNSELRALFEECIPTGTELARLLVELVSKKQAFPIYECLQLFSLQKSADEIGRNKMFDALKKIVLELQFWDIERQLIQNEKDDICPRLSDQDLRQKKMLLSYFDLPPISNSFDLLYEAGRTMKVLWPDHYEIELKQLMADWNNPEENSLLKERQLAKANIAKAEGHSDSRLVVALRAKLAMIEESLSMQNAKTIIVIQTILRLRPTASMDDYMPIIKEQLSKKDQSNGLILLGYYCLEEYQRAQNFLPLFWAHIAQLTPQANKLSLLISLKVTADFFVKFDFSSFKPSESQSQEQPFAYSQYLKKIQQFVLQKDSDIRILSIEGLCRLMFHNRVPEEVTGSCFMRLLLLWWETSSEEVSAKSVHTISIFIKQYIERGQDQVRKLSQWLCVFFKVALLQQKAKRSINKQKIVYNLKFEEFIKRAVLIGMTVLKYQKQSRQIIWKYQEAGAELGPQQMFLLFLMKHKQLHFCLEKGLNVCDFYEEAPLQTLILVKKQVELLLQQNNFVNSKKLESTIKRFQDELVDRIGIKKKQTFNQQLLNGLKQEVREYELLIDSAGHALKKQLQEQQIFIQNHDLMEEQSEEQVVQILQEEQIDESLAEIEEIAPLNEDSKEAKKPQRPKGNLGRISQKQQAEEQVDESTNRQPNKHKKHSNKLEERKPNRKKLIESPEKNESPEIKAQPEKRISGRTRSRFNV